MSPGGAGGFPGYARQVLKLNVVNVPFPYGATVGLGRFLSSDVHRTKRLLCIREQPFVFPIDRCQVYCRR